MTLLLVGFARCAMNPHGGLVLADGHRLDPAKKSNLVSEIDARDWFGKMRQTVNAAPENVARVLPRWPSARSELELKWVAEKSRRFHSNFLMASRIEATSAVSSKQSLPLIVA